MDVYIMKNSIHVKLNNYVNEYACTGINCAKVMGVYRNPDRRQSHQKDSRIIAFNKTTAYVVNRR